MSIRHNSYAGRVDYMGLQHGSGLQRGQSHIGVVVLGLLALAILQVLVSAQEAWEFDRREHCGLSLLDVCGLGRRS